MMRIILVHGINQQGKSEAAIKAEWLPHLTRGLGRDAVEAIDITAPFYGDKLHDLTANPDSIAIAQGPNGQPDADEAAFLASGLAETASAAGIGARAIETEQRTMMRETGDVGEQSFVMNRRFNAIVRLIEKVSPLHGTFVMRLLKQANAYLKKAGVGTKIDEIVQPVLAAGPAVIVAHSLGTVVSFKLLRAMAAAGTPVEVPLFVTVGSPLPLAAVQAALGPEFGLPPGVTRWLNAVDPDDFIALGRGLDVTTFADGIENVVDIDNDPDNAHAISGYLADPRVAQAIAEAAGL
jgi:hypothetical protein